MHNMMWCVKPPLNVRTASSWLIRERCFVIVPRLVLASTGCCRAIDSHAEPGIVRYSFLGAITLVFVVVIGERFS